ncbi:Uncharacterised protein [Mycobacteroides abscessus subsp. abscessus]|nr:Uncharacterised protein [Mycobacteroides abscessus subsp. abscessus]
MRRTIWARVSLPGPSKASSTSETRSSTALGAVVSAWWFMGPSLRVCELMPNAIVLLGI